MSSHRVVSRLLMASNLAKSSRLLPLLSQQQRSSRGVAVLFATQRFPNDRSFCNCTFILSRSFRTKHRWLSTTPEALSSKMTTSATARKEETAAKEAAVAAISTTSTPPLLVRTALVATTTAIGTPAFPVVGIVNFGLRYWVWDSSTRHAILGASTLLGGVLVLVKFAVSDLLPVAYSYGQLFLPFALVNGTLAASAYLVLDVALGTAQMASRKWVGAAMGAFVGFTGPVSGLYDTAFQWCYDIPEADGWFSYLLNNAIMLPISITTGAAVGLVMHPLLYYPIVGIPGIHWAKFSAPLLAGATFFMLHLYQADYYNTDLFPPETFLTWEEQRGLQLVPRFHPKRLQVEDWSLRYGYLPAGTGRSARQSVQQKVDMAQRHDDSRRRDMVFDSKRKAWLHYVTNGAFGSASAIDGIVSETEIQREGFQQFLASDGAVALILQRSNARSSRDTAAVREQLVNFANESQISSRRAGHGNTQQIVDRLDLASQGIALLLTEMLDKESDTAALTNEQQRNARIIRKLAPGIILFTKEETEETASQSVQSQLQSFGWRGIDDEETKNQMTGNWNVGVTKFLASEQAEATKRQIVWAMTGLSMIILISLLGGNQ